MPKPHRGGNGPSLARTAALLDRVRVGRLLALELTLVSDLIECCVNCDEGLLQQQLLSTS
eukprot:1882513-Amphidinium_carterae.1